MCVTKVIVQVTESQFILVNFFRHYWSLRPLLCCLAKASHLRFLHAGLPVGPSVCLSVVRPSVRSFACQSVPLSARPSVHLPVCLSVSLSVRVPVCPSARLFVSLTVCLSVLRLLSHLNLLRSRRGRGFDSWPSHTSDINKRRAPPRY